MRNGTDHKSAGYEKETMLHYGLAAARSAYGTESDELEAFEFWLRWFMKKYDAEQIRDFYDVVVRNGR